MLPTNSIYCSCGAHRNCGDLFEALAIGYAHLRAGCALPMLKRDGWVYEFKRRAEWPKESN